MRLRSTSIRLRLEMFRRRRPAMTRAAAPIWLAAWLGGCGDGGSHRGCREGSVGCACTDRGECDPGLECREDRCLAPDGCGDGVLAQDEECDDGNLVNEDACLDSCGFARCGDGFVREGVETCDDGDLEDGDGCDASCGRMGLVQWTRFHDGGWGNDIGRAVAVDGDGNVLLAYLDADLSGLLVPEPRATAAALERQEHTIDDPKAPAFEGRAE